MQAVTVKTKAELESAKSARCARIIVEGSLADKLKKSKKVAKAGAITIALVATALATIPFTGGLSMAAAAPVAAMTGFEIAAIIAAASVGLSLIIALFKDYEEVSYEAGKMVLKKKQS